MAIIPANEKVFMVSNGTNTIYGGSAALQAMNQWYTMEDVTNTVRPYQVFTALLTQTGGDFTQTVYIGTNYGPNPLIIGVTYTIIGNDTTDFTNVGAPNNEVGTSFIATGTNPNNQNANDQTYLDFNGGAPVATVLENTIGNIWFNYEDTGVYGCQSNDLFITGKTFILATPTSDSNTVSITITNGFTSVIYISPLNNALAQFNNGLINAPIEIRVYN
jgi:hypothetical protein